MSLDQSGKPATVLVRISFKAFGDAWIPVPTFPNSLTVTWWFLRPDPAPTIIDCVLPAWERGAFPTLTIAPDGAGVTVNGQSATLVTAWPTPTLPVRKRFVWEETIFFPDEDPFGQYVEAELETTPVTRTLQIVGELPDDV